jgi:hypothetical protein
MVATAPTTTTTPVPTTTSWVPHPDPNAKVPGYVWLYPPQVPQAIQVYAGFYSDGVTPWTWDNGKYFYDWYWKYRGGASLLETQEAKYTPYKGFYCRDASEDQDSDKGSPQGKDSGAQGKGSDNKGKGQDNGKGGKGQDSGKGQGKGKGQVKKKGAYGSHGGRSKGSKRERRPTQAGEVHAWKKVHGAYKDEIRTTGDHKLALEAFKKLECTLQEHKKPIYSTHEQNVAMKRHHLCAQGHCHDECYRHTKGRHAKRREKHYLKKHGGKYPKKYVQALNETEGSLPPALLELILLEEKITFTPPPPQRQPKRLREESHQFSMNPY